ncbi:unnamed protein product [Notodromas monacha]|uniref:Uncharacterized protein n=1 Tax=Notodromas monacha TaxID=399045 RepID=A0A7R9BZ94_9CRUS|nr:unnamed protein product [Notodromas monacha]CAG0924542.1 unnamed protein product [Notodromas monacha]
MAPNNTQRKEALDVEELDILPDEVDPGKASTAEEKVDDFKPELVWLNVYWYTSLHLMALYGIYLGTFYAKWPTIALAVLWHVFGALGVTAGVHRLWSHRSYKARLPLRTFLAMAFTIAFQNSIYIWVRDHRVHHKFSETNADPHNVKRGFFFAHVGWLLHKKHPDVLNKGKTVSMDDVLADPVVYYQHK